MSDVQRARHVEVGIACRGETRETEQRRRRRRCRWNEEKERGGKKGCRWIEEPRELRGEFIRQPYAR